MKIILILLLGLSLSFTTNGQIGKIKIKKPKIVKKIEPKKTKEKPKEKKVETQKTEIKDTKKEEKKPAKQEVAGDPQTIKIENEASEALDNVKKLFANRAETSAKTADEIKAIFQKFQNKFSSLKNYYKDTSTRLPEFKDAYDTYKKLVNTEVKMREKMKSVTFILKTRSEAADRAKEDFKPGMFYNSTSNLVYYKDYKEAKDEFEQSGYINEQMSAYVTNIEDYFDKYVTGVAGHKFTEYMTTNSAFNENDWKGDPKREISQLEEDLTVLDELVYTRVKDSKWVDDLKQKMLDQKAKLQDYIDSGAYDKYLAEEHSRMVEQVRMYKSHRTEAAVVATVKSKHTSGKYGSLKKVIITSDWYVEKNVWGIPIEKRTRIQVAVNQNGKCNVYEGYVYKPYLGGGSYGSPKLSWYHSRQEIKCHNIDK